MARLERGDRDGEDVRRGGGDMNMIRRATAAVAVMSVIFAMLSTGVQAAPGATGPLTPSFFRQTLADRFGPLSPRRPSGSNRSPGIECVIGPTEDANVTLDCPNEYGLPTDEPSIAVDPGDPGHIVTASLNERSPHQTV